MEGMGVLPHLFLSLRVPGNVLSGLIGAVMPSAWCLSESSALPSGVYWPTNTVKSRGPVNTLGWQKKSARTLKCNFLREKPGCHSIMMAGKKHPPPSFFFFFFFYVSLKQPRFLCVIFFSFFQREGKWC